MGNVLLEQEAFIAECRKLSNPVLIDIGHAHANHWDPQTCDGGAGRTGSSLITYITMMGYMTAIREYTTAHWI